MTANTNSETITKIIPVAALESLEAKVKKLNRKASKNGFEVITLQEVRKTPIYRAEMVEYNNDGERNYRSIIFDSEERYNASKEDPRGWNHYIVAGVEVTVNIPVHGFNGYRLVGCTKTEHGVTMLSNLEPEKFDFSADRGTCRCDHCNSNRDRHSVFFVADEQDKVKYLGSSCVNLFFPKEVNALRWFDIDGEIRSFLSNMDEDGNYYCSSGPTLQDVKYVLAMGLAAVKKVGYTSVTAARNAHECGDIGKTSTKDWVISEMSAKPEEKVLDREEIEEQYDKAEELLEWAEAKKDENEYFGNVFELINAKYISDKHYGYIIGIYGWYQSYLNEKAKAESSKSEYIGKIKDRLTFVGKIVRERCHDGFYGLTCFYTIETEEGNMIHYKRANGYWDGFGEGDTVEFVATIKEHKVNKYTKHKETIVQRPAKVKKVE